MSLEKPNPKLLKERLYRTEECITKRRRLLFQHKLREQTLVGLDFRLEIFGCVYGGIRIREGTFFYILSALADLHA